MLDDIEYNHNTFKRPVTYKAYPSKLNSKVTWYVGQCKNEADYLYCQTWNHEGFGGRTFTIDVEGVQTEFHGPWLGNPDSLLRDTDYDCTDKHLISYELRTKDGKFIMGQYNQLLRFNTGRDYAQSCANDLQEPVLLTQRSFNGGSEGLVYPEENKND